MFECYFEGSFSLRNIKMPENKNKSMQFLFGDRELIINISDLLTAPVDVIVNPANGGLSHGGGVAGQIAQQGSK